MPKLSEDRLPRYCKHNQNGQACVYIGGQRIPLGPHGSAESRHRYNRLIAEWLASGRHLVPVDHRLTIIELIDRFWTHAKSYYRTPDGKPAIEAHLYRYALRYLKQLYGQTAAEDFGPLGLKAVREAMLSPTKVKVKDKATGEVKEIERPGMCRNQINRQIGRIKHVFKWAVAEQLVQSTVFEALRCVEGLRRGRSQARETEPIRPVPESDVLAVKPFVSRQVWALIQLQMLTGARGGELLILRGCDLDTSKPTWTYKPSSHKTAHHGHQRVIHLGPQAIAIVKEFLKPNPTDYLFSPIDAEAERLAKLHEKRKTPLSCGNRPGTNCVNRRKRKPADRYTKDSYARCITRACRKAGVGHWHPHRLRHAAATKIRKGFGLEAARTVLGQHSDAVAEVYAERDQQLAATVAAQIG